MESDDDVIDLLGYAISDARRLSSGQLTAEFTRQDVLKSIKDVLREIMIREPTDDDANSVLQF